MGWARRERGGGDQGSPPHAKGRGTCTGHGEPGRGDSQPLHPLSKRERGGSSGGVTGRGGGGRDCPSGPGTRERGAGCGMWGLGGAHPPAPSEREGERGGNREGEGADSAEMGAGTEGVDTGQTYLFFARVVPYLVIAD